MADKDFSKLGEQIQSIVEDAVNSSNFEQLNKNIKGSIQSVFDELNIQTDKINSKKSVNIKINGDDKSVMSPKRYQTNPPGSISGVVLEVVGGFFTFIFGLSILSIAVVGSAVSGADLAANIAIPILLPFFGISVLGLGKGIAMRGRVKRFRNYIRTIGNRPFCKIQELAMAINKKESYVAKDIQKMIDKKFFINGHMDIKKQNLMLDDETYHQYLDAQRAYEKRLLEEKKIQDSDKEVFSSTGINNQDLIKTIEEGNNYILQIRQANDAIEGEEISKKLFRLETIIKKIFEVLKEKPEQLGKLRKFMNYYMPTTLKLVKTYQQLDAQPVEGENIRKSKQDIEETLDTINLAYEKLLDSFFEDAAMDINSDITVLQTMLAQEGLTKKQFDEKDKWGNL